MELKRREREAKAKVEKLMQGHRPASAELLSGPIVRIVLCQPPM